MGNIIILDEDTANRIAAGEVVERPSSVVKELAENSLDAGATKIAIDIKKGGVASITVSDDGEGFYGDDIPLAFERYATSKLRVAEDLERVATLGFRGEALPSIASVSKVKLTTRRRDSEYGRFVELHAGKIIRDEETGCPYGTSVTVSELFYNIPARYKFLKKDTAEAAQISELAGRLAIGRPDVSFSLTTQSAQILHTQSGGKPEDAIFAVLGKDIFNGLAPVRQMSAERMNYAVSGYIGKPEIARANRNYQFFYINGRFVKNRTITAAIEEAYKTYIPGRRFPVAILYIALDAALVDVNAHPAKTEVRFYSESELFRAVYHAVVLSLRNMDGGAVRTGYTGDAGDYASAGYAGDAGDTASAGYAGDAGYKRKSSGGESPGAVSEEDEEPHITDGWGSERDGLYDNTTAPDAKSHTAGLINAGFERAQGNYPVQERLNITDRQEAAYPYPQGADDRGAARSETLSKTPGIDAARYVGQLFGMYLAFETNDALILVDQHAAHERLLYEKIKSQYEKSGAPRQTLLESITVNLLPDEMAFAREAAPFMKQAGFYYEEFGREAVILREAPLYMERADVMEFFLESVEVVKRDYAIGKNTGGAAIPYESMLYDIACKAAVKGGARLTAAEAAELLRALDGLPKPLTCPHGRPLIIEMSKRELDRKFKRI